MTPVQCTVPPEICTLSGGYLNFDTPDTYTFPLDEIATGLSRECRWGRQCRDFYSVAQHAVLVSCVVPTPLALWGLHHDDAEAYIGDMTSPLKQLMPEFKAIEKRIEAAVFAQLGIHAFDDGHRYFVKSADRRVESTERRDLMPEGHADYYKAWRDAPPLALTVEPWSMEKAKRLYLLRHKQLTTSWDGFDDLGDKVELLALQGAVDAPSAKRIDR